VGLSGTLGIVVYTAGWGMVLVTSDSLVQVNPCVFGK